MFASTYGIPLENRHLQSLPLEKPLADENAVLAPTYFKPT